jgi:hypothetical protein
MLRLQMRKKRPDKTKLLVYYYGDTTARCFDLIDLSAITFDKERMNRLSDQAQRVVTDMSAGDSWRERARRGKQEIREDLAKEPFN